MSNDHRKTPLLRTRLQTPDGKPLPPGHYHVQITDVLPSIGPDGVGRTAVIDVLGPAPAPKPTPPMRMLKADDKKGSSR